MIRKYKNLIALFLFVLSGCATPPAVKQALIDVDKGYGDNIEMMQQYRQLVQSINERQRYWNRYINQRLLLNLALKSMTQDHWRDDITRDITKEEKVDDTAMFLGNDLRRVVNDLRLAGLAPQNGSKGTVVFEAGKPDNTASQIVTRLPEIVNRVTEKVDEGYNEVVKADMSHFDTYRTNVAALRQVNSAIKRYLDIDITVTSKDVSEVANAIRALQQ